ncbi:uncharacterized protein SPPG_01294 [Spizellomyces punctatus DAOM BR117]|uniref:Ras-GEF domain-containing protein n=1 Tax=Spizellomyces punctatus (strain DAOM BR117) TaxID=645134 RepID=A0A0L0HRT4_SPIPD|nr:uncharacterized protein SPPG_01294 [Spizellomyces punctatus DAOM BR117]KND03838.1 hypothetical protein SPPG_01294 [Spizellomyces punctatus DAOM BR117]|eukprot:XP_016611877.1 hypothetical protein SPPG_01294 [Spizellomyces punctatus DAOM BR117]
MSNIDFTIADADRHLAQLDLQAAFHSYLQAVSLIIAHLAKETVFSANGETTENGDRKFKNVATTLPDDAERLFGLAHLCFTEAEDIMFGTVSVDDLEPYDEHDDASIHQPEGDESERASPPKDFREHRLSRPRSIRSVESSIKRSSTWNSYRSSLARALGSSNPSEERLAQRNATPDASSWLLGDTNRATSPPPPFDADSIHALKQSASSIPQQQPSAPGATSPPRESLIWQFPSVPSQGKANDTQQVPHGFNASVQNDITPYAPSSPSAPPPRESLIWHFPSVPREQAKAKSSPLGSPNNANLPTSPSTPQSPMPPPPAPLSHSSSAASVTSQSPANSYLPMIPTSPLIYQHRILSDQYNTACSQLQVLENTQHTGRPYSQTAGTLSQIRRLVETSSVAKNRLVSLNAIISEWGNRKLVDVSADDLGKAILCFDVDMFRGIKAVDLLGYATSGGSASDAIRRAQDFAHFLYRTVQSTILEHDQPISRASCIVRWITVAQVLFINRDFHGLQAILSALSSVLVARLSGTWKTVSKKYRGLYDDLLRVSADMKDPRWFRQQLDRVEKPCVPILDRLLSHDAAEAKRIMDVCKEDEAEWDKDVGTVANPVVDVGPMHWLVTRCWMNDRHVEGLSYMWEPEPGGASSKQSRKGSEDTVTSARPPPFTPSLSSVTVGSMTPPPAADAQMDHSLLRRLNQLGPFSKK